MDTDIVRRLRPLVPDGGIFVAESGISDELSAARARAWGADAILVGEALMRASDPMAKARELSSAGGGATAALFTRTFSPYIPADSVFVKVCGLATPEHVVAAARYGADAYGLVFAPMAPDHRRLTLECAAELVWPIHGVWEDMENVYPLAIGVFVNAASDTITQIARAIGLDAVQLSGDEPAEQCAEVGQLTGLPILKALRLRATGDLSLLDQYALAGATLVLDTPKDGSYGGTGETGDWALAAEAARRWPIILSGGLTPENVADAIKTVQPRGVDVSSGVETNRAKDPDKIARFIDAAHGAQ